MQFRQCSIVGKKYTEENGMLMVALDASTLNLQRIEHLSVIYSNSSINFEVHA